MEKSNRPTGNILVVDDEVGMREGCRRALTAVDYAVDTAADVTAGLEMARERQYDLYLLDVMLPDGSGLDLLDSLLELDPTAICIIITGFGSIQMAVEAVRRGAYDFLSKPFTSDELIVAVDKGIERGQLKAMEAEMESLQQAKAELERLDEAKSQLMLKVAHELRAPTAAVQSYVNLIMAGYVTGNELKSTLSRVQDRLQEMLDLVSDLLELARLKQAKDHLADEATPQPMAEILREVYELFQEQAHQKRQSFQLEILDHPVIVADRDHLRQIWTNLISNAIKYTPEGGRISVSLAADDGNLIGTVADSGIGIAEKDLPQLFTDFFRTDEAKASREIGTGLGLSIVKQIVDSYGGEIKVTSRLGQGSRFKFILPLQRPAVEAEPEQSASRSRGPVPQARPSTHTQGIIFGADQDSTDRA